MFPVMLATKTWPSPKKLQPSAAPAVAASMQIRKSRSIARTAESYRAGRQESAWMDCVLLRGGSLPVIFR